MTNVIKRSRSLELTQEMYAAMMAIADKCSELLIYAAECGVLHGPSITLDRYNSGYLLRIEMIPEFNTEETKEEVLSFLFSNSAIHIQTANWYSEDLEVNSFSSIEMRTFALQGDTASALSSKKITLLEHDSGVGTKIIRTYKETAIRLLDEQLQKLKDM